MRARILAAFLSALFLSACDRTSTPEQDVIVFHGGTVLTVDAEFSVVDTFAIRNEQIVAVGSHDEVLELVGDSARQVDLAGKVVLPAFIDAHVHTVAATKFAIFEDVGLTRFASVEEALDHMITIGKSAAAGEWLLFQNIDFGTQSSQTDKLTAEMLDQVSTENPVFVFHAGGHVSSANTRMLEIMGVTTDTPDPEAGGSFGRDDDGEPDGMLYGFASMLAMGVLEPFTNFDMDAGIAAKSDQWLSRGIGTVGDAGVGATGDASELDLLLGYAADGSMKFRVRGYLSYGLEKEWDAREVVAGFGDSEVRIVGYKLSADGSNQARTGLQRDPYPGSDSHGIAYLTEDQIYTHVMDKSAKGFQLAIHGNGDASIDNIISAVARAKSDGADLQRVRIEHCSLVQDDQLAKLKELDISCSFLIGHVRLWGGGI